MRIIIGDALTELRKLQDESVHMCVTSPPYWGLRDYGIEGQLGLEKTPEEYVSKLVGIFREVRRVLRDDGTLWLNLGDSYATQSGAYGGDEKYKGLQKNMGLSSTQKQVKPKEIGLKHKDLVGIPWRVAFALQQDGWYLRSDIIWHKPNPMPESVKDRPTKSHEYIFLLSKSAKYFFDQDAVREESTYPDDNRKSRVNSNAKDFQRELGNRLEKGDKTYPFRNIRSVWTIATTPYPEAHFATFPRELAERCIKAGCPINGVVLDPFAGSGTTGEVARNLGRDFILIELNEKYLKLQEKRSVDLFCQPEVTK